LHHQVVAALSGRGARSKAIQVVKVIAVCAKVIVFHVGSLSNSRVYTKPVGASKPAPTADSVQFKGSVAALRFICDK
jgi:hypothetical protein